MTKLGKVFFALDFTRLARFASRRQAAARKHKSKKVFFALGFARLALLCFAKIGCGSEAQIKKSVFCFGLHSPCTIFAP
ncbi:hypothetical protein [Prevotellamassilia timonensis]|uniref:hypothetical protein n=1 Tax=Prevotellamassilia timonensis TaxID=1852370 RepID=UPI0030788138